MRCTAQSHSLTVASKDVSLPLVAFSAPCVPSSRITGVCPSDSSSVLFYLNFKSSFKLIYALRLLPGTPVTWQPSRILAVSGCVNAGRWHAISFWGMALSSLKVPVFTAEGRLCPQAFHALQEEYLLSGLYARGPNELCCCANVAQRGGKCFVKARVMWGSLFSLR